MNWYEKPDAHSDLALLVEYLLACEGFDACDIPAVLREPWKWNEEAVEAEDWLAHGRPAPYECVDCGANTLKRLDWCRDCRERNADEAAAEDRAEEARRGEA